MQKHVLMVIERWISEMIDVKDASMTELIAIVKLLIILLKVILHTQVTFDITHTLDW